MIPEVEEPAGVTTWAAVDAGFARHAIASVMTRTRVFRVERLRK
jgi:hypothetical protein